MVQQSIKEISKSLKTKKIETIYFTGTEEYLDCYVPCKYIVDREVINCIAEVIEINELLTRKPNRLNENSVVVLSYGDNLEHQDVEQIISSFKKKNVVTIGVSETESPSGNGCDYFVLCDNNLIEESIPSALFLLTCGLLHEREEIVYPSLYSGMERNIKKLKQYEREIDDILNTITDKVNEKKRINIIASGTDVATQLYLKKYFEKEDGIIGLMKSGEFLNRKNTNIQSDEYYLLILGIDSSEDLDLEVLRKFKDLDLNFGTFKIDKINKLSELDRPFAKVITSIIIFFAIKNK